MAKILYYWDESKKLDHSEIFMTDADLPNPLPETATFVAPDNGLYEPITWNGESWDGITQEAWLSQHPAPTPVPTTEQQMIMQQALDINQLKQLTMSQASQIAILSKGSAE